MKKNTIPAESVAAGEPAPISALPDPTLESQLALMTKERDDLTDLVLVRNKTITELQEDVSELKSKIQEMEKNTFVFALGNMGAGEVMTEAGVKMLALCEAVMKQKEKGTFIFKATVKPFVGKSEALLFVPDIEIKPPKPDPEMSLFFLGPEGELTIQEVRQRTFVFKAPPEDE